MSVFEEEIAARRCPARHAVDRRQDFFPVVIRGPSQSRIVNVRGHRSKSLQTVNENGGLRILSTQFAPEEPRRRSLSETHHITIIILLLAARSVEVYDQLPNR